jgi:hypothetical protein
MMQIWKMFQFYLLILQVWNMIFYLYEMNIGDSENEEVRWIYDGNRNIRYTVWGTLHNMELYNLRPPNTNQIK